MSRSAKQRVRVPLELPTENGAKQSFKEECDINNIVAHHKRTGLIHHLASGQPQFLDVSEVADFRTALTHVRNVKSFFMGLPSELRSEFDNDPAAFVDGLNDPETLEMLNEYGIEPQAPEDPPTPSEAPQAASDGEGGDNEA